jgi:hypothetical protein
VSHGLEIVFEHGGFRWACSCGGEERARSGPARQPSASTSITRNAKALRKTDHERNRGAVVSIKLKQSQRVFIVQCGFVVLMVIVAIRFVAALV